MVWLVQSNNQFILHIYLTNKGIWVAYRDLTLLRYLLTILLSKEENNIWEYYIYCSIKTQIIGNANIARFPWVMSAYKY